MFQRAIPARKATTVDPGFHIQALMHQPPQEHVVPETSSAPISIPEDQQSLFREILELLEEKGTSFCVAGAFALREHTGICRDTKDLDLFLTPANAALALRHLREKGFECEVRDPVWLYKAHRDEFFVDLITGMSNATILVDDSWIENAKPACVQGVQTRVLAAEELVASKLFIARRERFDGADVVHVIYGTRGKLNWQRILRLVGEHWEMLLWALVLYRYCYPAQTHYVPKDVWSDLLRRFQEAISRPDPKASFRGSLVDDKQFAIDVNEWGLENLMAELRERRLKTMPANCKTL
jgi:predicted nucleotidyltransferase